MFFIAASSRAEPSAALLRVTIDRTIVLNHPELLDGDICEQLTLHNNTLVRPPVDLLLICLGLQQSGVQARIELVESPSYQRSLRMLKNGKADLMGESVWNADVDETLFAVSQPVLKFGDFEKGIYTLEDHSLQQSWSEHSQLSDYTGITLKSWHQDWRIINELSPKVNSTARYDSLLKMLAAGRSDFTLHEFPRGTDLIVDAHGVRLAPLPGIKVVIPDERVLVASKQPHALVTKLWQSLAELEQRGEIRALYQRHGFMRKKTANWRVVNKLFIEIKAAPVAPTNS
ncbi:transporter substrate-binding domain-containing protein [Agaribacterium haliotis]|uniref:transporter substrate-binding domain-containing protein n=1 Tax=Agaribacterium haliotis TaxID=2013869 RepID=UPI0013042451|nr:transporter substrate-binding domain-containing protein [Agaribacterium haliotis]